MLKTKNNKPRKKTKMKNAKTFIKAKPKYGWIIDQDNIGAGIQLPTYGPCNITPELEEAAKERGQAFRMYDDDGELYYSGRIIGNGCEEYSGFEPLDDFGAPDSGCTRIDLKREDNGLWEAL